VALKHIHSMLTNKTTLMKIKTSPPYTPQNEMQVYLDPTARAKFDERLGSWAFSSSSSASAPASIPVAAPSALRSSSSAASLAAPTLSASSSSSFVAMPSLASSSSSVVEPCRVPCDDITSVPAGNIPSATRLAVTLREASEGLRHATDKGIGVDCEDVAAIDPENAIFLERNFTSEEISYCRKAKLPEEVRSKFTGRWAAKEAVVKAISNAAPDTRNLWQGSAAPLKDIEIVSSSSGAPVVVLHDYAKQVASVLGISDIKVTITHCGDYAIAQAIAR